MDRFTPLPCGRRAAWCCWQQVLLVNQWDVALKLMSRRVLSAQVKRVKA
jgi:hypothetical protein